MEQYFRDDHHWVPSETDKKVTFTDAKWKLFKRVLNAPIISFLSKIIPAWIRSQFTMTVLSPRNITSYGSRQLFSKVPCFTSYNQHYIKWKKIAAFYTLCSSISPSSFTFYFITLIPPPFWFIDRVKLSSLINLSPTEWS